MSIMNVLAAVAVKDLDTAAAWYARLLGQEGRRPMPEVAEWRFPRGGWLQLFADAERAGKSSVTIAVDDLAAQLIALRDLGVSVHSTSESDKVKVAMTTDPDGNHLAFAQALTDELAQ